MRSQPAPNQVHGGRLMLNCSPYGPSCASEFGTTARGKHTEHGQATVEFALILFPFLLLVVGLVQFGIAVSFWQDQQRLAAAGARVAAVNCTAATWCTPTLAEYLELSRCRTAIDRLRQFASNPRVGRGGATAIAGDYNHG